MAKGKPFKPTNRIQTLRAESKLSLKEVSDSIGTTSSTISRIERGDRDLDYEWLVRIAPAFKVPPADLLLDQDGGLNKKERRIIDIYRSTSESGRRAIVAVAESQSQPNLD